MRTGTGTATEHSGSTAPASGAAPEGSSSSASSGLARLRTAFSGLPRRTLIGALSGVLVIALVVYVVFAAIAVHTRSAVTADRAAAEAAARSGVERLLTYDSADLQPTRTAIDEVTAGAFHDQFVGVFTQIVAPNAIEQRAASRATVRASGTVSADPGRVVVLLFLNQTTSSTQLPAPRIDTIQTRVTMTQVDERWVVSGLDQL